MNIDLYSNGTVRRLINFSQWMSAIHFAVIVNANISLVIMYQMLIKNIIEYKIVGICLHFLERNENNGSMHTTKEEKEDVNMIYTSYFAQMRNFPENYIPVAICGGLPNWYKGRWYRKPAPKIGFFQEWKRTGDNEYYIEHYQKEVLDLLDYQKVLADLQMQVPEEIRATMQDSVWNSKDVHLVLLCYEKPTDFCHRHLFAEWLSQKAGIKIKEFQKEKL